MTPRVDEVGRDRLDDLEPLWRALHEHHAALAPPHVRVRPLTDSWRRQRERYGRLFAGEGAYLLLATDADGALIGYALAHAAPALSIWQTTDTVVLVETLSVAADHRGCGVGSALLERVQHEAWRRFGAETWLSALSTNDDALRFYERHGYARFSVELRRAPPPDA